MEQIYQRGLAVKLSSILSALQHAGRVPKSIRLPVAIWGGLVLTSVVVVFVRLSWGGSDIGDGVVAFAALVCAVGLAGLLGGKND